MAKTPSLTETCRSGSQKAEQVPLGSMLGFYLRLLKSSKQYTSHPVDLKDRVWDAISAAEKLRAMESEQGSAVDHIVTIPGVILAHLGINCVGKDTKDYTNEQIEISRQDRSADYILSHAAQGHDLAKNILKNLGYQDSLVKAGLLPGQASQESDKLLRFIADITSGLSRMDCDKPSLSLDERVINDSLMLAMLSPSGLDTDMRFYSEELDEAYRRLEAFLKKEPMLTDSGRKLSVNIMSRLTDHVSFLKQTESNYNIGRWSDEVSDLVDFRSFRQYEGFIGLESIISRKSQNYMLAVDDEKMQLVFYRSVLDRLLETLPKDRRLDLRTCRDIDSAIRIITEEGSPAISIIDWQFIGDPRTGAEVIYVLLQDDPLNVYRMNIITSHPKDEVLTELTGYIKDRWPKDNTTTEEDRDRALSHALFMLKYINVFGKDEMNADNLSSIVGSWKNRPSSYSDDVENLLGIIDDHNSLSAYADPDELRPGAEQVAQRAIKEDKGFGLVGTNQVALVQGSDQHPHPLVLHFFTGPEAAIKSKLHDIVPREIIRAAAEADEYHPYQGVLISDHKGTTVSRAEYLLPFPLVMKTLNSNAAIPDYVKASFAMELIDPFIEDIEFILSLNLKKKIEDAGIPTPALDFEKKMRESFNTIFGHFYGTGLSSYPEISEFISSTGQFLRRHSSAPFIDPWPSNLAYDARSLISGSASLIKNQDITDQLYSTLSYTGENYPEIIEKIMDRFSRDILRQGIKDIAYDGMTPPGFEFVIRAYADLFSASRKMLDPEKANIMVFPDFNGVVLLEHHLMSQHYLRTPVSDLYKPDVLHDMLSNSEPEDLAARASDSQRFSDIKMLLIEAGSLYQDVRRIHYCLSAQEFGFHNLHFYNNRVSDFVSASRYSRLSKAECAKIGVLPIPDSMTRFVERLEEGIQKKEIYQIT